MATLRSQSFPLTTLPVGTFALPQVAIPDDVTTVYFEVARCTTLTPTIWPDAGTQLLIDLEASFDGGVTWLGGGGFGAVGGIHVRRDGSEAQISAAQWGYPLSPNRLLRGVARVIGGPVRTQGFLELRS